MTEGKDGAASGVEAAAGEESTATQQSRDYSTLTNTEFCAELYREAPEGSFGWLHTLAGSPKDDDARWGGLPLKSRGPNRLPIGNNNYATIGVFNRMARQESASTGYVALMVDDVGSKGRPLETLPLPPSYVVETSEGSYHAVYFIERDTNLAMCKHIMKALNVSSGDYEMNPAATAYFRLPQGRNGRTGWDHKVRTWAPERRYTALEVAQAFGIDPNPPERKPPPREGGKQVSANTLDSALWAITYTRDMGRNAWRNIMFAYKAGNGDEETFIDWCKHQDDCSEDALDERYQWRHAKKEREDGDNITVGTLFWRAKQNGWEDPDEPEILFSVNGRARTDEAYTGDEADENPVPSRAELAIGEDEFASAQLTPECLVRDYLYADLAMISAGGAVGKTTQILYESVCFVLRRAVWGLEVVSPGWVLIVTAEDERERLVARLGRIIDEMRLSEVERAIVRRDVCIWDVSGEYRKLVAVSNGNVVPTLLADHIVARFEADPPKMALFDPVVSFGADEERVNTNEQAIVMACRRIIKGLHCCVRLLTHTGQAAFRSGSLDQYTARGGTALSDGARMVAVLQPWTAESKLDLPPGMRAEPDSSISILARPKGSHCAPNQPLIWIKRTGFTYEHAVAVPVDSESRQLAYQKQVLKFLESEMKDGVAHTQNSLQALTDTLGIRRAELRDIVALLKAHQMVFDADLPQTLRRGRRQTFLCPSHCADDVGAIGAVGAE